jgi:hypothetical protein
MWINSENKRSLTPSISKPFNFCHATVIFIQARQQINTNRYIRSMNTTLYKSTRHFAPGEKKADDMEKDFRL